MKQIALLTVLILSSKAFGAMPSEADVYSILERAKVFIHFSPSRTSHISRMELQSLRCRQFYRDKDTDCFYVDAARPRDDGAITGADAKAMYEIIVASGATVGHLFGETHTSLSTLRCQKTFSPSSGSVEVQCETFKRLLNSPKGKILNSVSQ